MVLDNYGTAAKMLLAIADCRGIITACFGTCYHKPGNKPKTDWKTFVAQIRAPKGTPIETFPYLHTTRNTNQNTSLVSRLVARLLSRSMFKRVARLLPRKI
jgi:hypothetical protein